MKPAAYLLHSGRLYQDRASTNLIHAEKDRKDRNDGSQIEPLYRHSDVAPLVEALRLMLKRVDREQCHHVTTVRGGHLWTICEDCGQKWADDEGGFKPYVEPSDITKARDALSTLDADGSK